MTDAKEPLVRYGYRLSVRDDSAHRDAERAVIEAAKAWEEVEPLACHMKKKQDAEMALVRAVDALRALEGDA